ncbi:hypothetical protein Y1Q_0015862 [Alligator mississippiensis]|uniref:Uncharacterized protein n=1 Tax=Alligator mississippiensis TaxID=8496 RepID=A0A151MH74_ALLMI|nr:hypothetical protein Y1Q_0015862 [Alligator mississippiensis]
MDETDHLPSRIVLRTLPVSIGTECLGLREIQGGNCALSFNVHMYPPKICHICCFSLLQVRRLRSTSEACFPPRTAPEASHLCTPTYISLFQRIHVTKMGSHLA